MAVLEKGTLFPSTLSKEIFDKVRGKSSLSSLSGQEPVPFNGTDIFIFSFDNEVALLGESEKKTEGGISLEPVRMKPLKIEYGARVSDEFLYASEEAQVDILTNFNEGFAKKVARGLDIMAMHGVNPRTGNPSDLIGKNSFDTADIATIEYSQYEPDQNIEDAIATTDESDYDVSGMVISKSMRSALASQKGVDGHKIYPQLAWGSNPGNINGIQVEVNSTVSAASSKDKAIIGDFVNAFKWGYAKGIEMQVIEYGDPDNSGKDLKGYNQVYLRGEAYIGWAILDPAAFAIIAGDGEEGLSE